MLTRLKLPYTHKWNSQRCIEKTWLKMRVGFVAADDVWCFLGAEQKYELTTCYLYYVFPLQSTWLPWHWARKSLNGFQAIKISSINHGWCRHAILACWFIYIYRVKKDLHVRQSCFFSKRQKQNLIDDNANSSSGCNFCRFCPKHVMSGSCLASSWLQPHQPK